MIPTTDCERTKERTVWDEHERSGIDHQTTSRAIPRPNKSSGKTKEKNAQDVSRLDWNGV
jgi:hypothetical protein